LNKQSGEGGRANYRKCRHGDSSPAVVRRRERQQARSDLMGQVCSHFRRAWADVNLGVFERIYFRRRHSDLRTSEVWSTLSGFDSEV